MSAGICCGWSSDMLTLEAVVAESSSAQSKEVPLDGPDNMEFAIISAGGLVLDLFLIRVTLFKGWIKVLKMSQITSLHDAGGEPLNVVIYSLISRGQI
ncbi:hypothetical protein BJX68DRAFT_250673, partial [Aspergillus pseudodeflectus]